MKGIKAEDIKGDDEREIFNEVISQENMAPEVWRKVVIKVIPIRSTRHKIFPTLLHSRLHSKLDRHHSADQGGFRCSFQTADHLVAHRLLEQMSKAWTVKVWHATVDFAEAFDTKHHEAIWKSLPRFNVSYACICLLKNHTQTSVPPSSQTKRVTSPR